MPGHRYGPDKRRYAKQGFPVLMQRTIMELNEIPCIPLETEIASKQQARLMTCFAGTSNFNPNAASFTSAAVKLAAPTALPRHLHQARRRGAGGATWSMAFRTGGAVMLTDLSPTGAAPQLPALATAHEEKRIGELLGAVMDKYGNHPSDSASPDWGMKRQALSPRYTTEWDALAFVKAC